MKINATTALSTSRILLVPYSEHHVLTYHEWMKDPELQAATASQPLSIDEEYAMQTSWRTDNDKLTFIICLPSSRSAQPGVEIGIDDAPERMIGDVNLFLIEPDEEDEAGVTVGSGKRVVGEIELMIARQEFRKRGYGKASLQTFFHYLLGHWQEIAKEHAVDDNGASLLYLRVKIHQTNHASIALFKNLGFTYITETPNFFGEIELRWNCDLSSVTAVDSSYRVLNYNVDTA